MLATAPIWTKLALMTALVTAPPIEIDGQKLRIEYDSPSSAFNWIIPEEVEVTDAYWFSWKAFHPDTEIWRSGSAERGP